MDTLTSDRVLLERILCRYTGIKYAHGDITVFPVFDRENDHYLVVHIGWEGYKRVHGVLIHVDILDGKFWVQRDGTEAGVATALLEAGVSRERIVLAFQHPMRRQYSEFAVL